MVISCESGVCANLTKFFSPKSASRGLANNYTTTSTTGGDGNMFGAAAPFFGTMNGIADEGGSPANKEVNRLQEQLVQLDTYIAGQETVLEKMKAEHDERMKDLVSEGRKRRMKERKASEGALDASAFELQGAMTPTQLRENPPEAQEPLPKHQSPIGRNDDVYPPNTPTPKKMVVETLSLAEEEGLKRRVETLLGPAVRSAWSDNKPQLLQMVQARLRQEQIVLERNRTLYDEVRKLDERVRSEPVRDAQELDQRQTEFKHRIEDYERIFEDMRRIGGTGSSMAA